MQTQSLRRPFPNRSLGTQLGAPLLAALWLCGCATTTPVQPPRAPSAVKDWHGLDSVEVLQEFRLADYSRLVVEKLDSAATPLPYQGEKTYEPVVAVLKRIDDLYAPEITRKLAGKLAVADAKSDPGALPQTLRLRGKVADIHPGSQAARYWAGFGVGRAWVRIHGELVDATTGDVLLRFEQQRVDHMGPFGGGYVALLTECAAYVGRDVGDLLRLFDGP